MPASSSPGRRADWDFGSVGHPVRVQDAEDRAVAKRDGGQEAKKDGGKDGQGDDEKDGDESRKEDGGKGGGGKAKGGKKDEGDGKKDEGDKDDGKGGKKRRWPVIVLIIAVVLAVIGAAVYWYLTRNEESTDDAYTEGNAAMIAPKVSGYVVERRVDDNTFVRAGDLMLRIDPRDYIATRDQNAAQLGVAQAQLDSAQVQLDLARATFPARLRQAEAQREQAQAQQQKAEADLKRQRSVDPRATTQQDIDAAVANARVASATTGQQTANVAVNRPVPLNIASVEAQVKQAEAQVTQARAQLAQADLNLSYTEMRAPWDGWVTRRNVDVGTYAQAGQQVFYLVSPQTWVVANFKEGQLDRMRAGQQVQIAVDAYPHLKLRGHVDSIQEGSGARFTTFPTENATGNYVKIVRRVPVKIVIDEGLDPNQGLPLGLSVEPTVTVK